MNRAVVTLLSLFGLAAIGSTIYLWYENDKLKKDVLAATYHGESLSSQLNSLSTEKDELVQQNNALDEERQAQIFALNTANEKHKEELAKMIAEREKQKETLVTEHSKMMSELKQTIDDQRVKISELNGVIKVKMENKILFPSGQATVSAEGKKVLAKVAGGFAKIDDKRFRIEGHTDNIPINNERFPSNWELSSTRAANVLHVILATGKVDPALFEIVGMGEFHPIASNKEEKGRAQNRRIEILLLPLIEEVLKKSIESR